ncbi:MAG: ABC transporter permease [Enterococcus sp.]
MTVTYSLFRRFLELLVSLFLIGSATFFLLAAVPGDALSAQTDKMPENIREQLYENYGLDQPVLSRYVITLENVAHGNFGESLVTPGKSLTEVLAEKFPPSIRLGLQQILFGIPLGLLLGALAAVFKNSWVDRSVTVLSLLLISVPSLIIGLLLQSYFGGKLGLFPIIGWPEGEQLWWGGWEFTILPMIAGGMGYIAAYARLLKNSMLDVLGSDHIITARAKGVAEWKIVTRHVIRNAFVPIITSLPLSIVFCITGSVFVESIFVIPGVGQYFVEALTARDVPIILGETTLLAAMYIVTLFITDIFYTLIDPRISLVKEG